MKKSKVFIISFIMICLCFCFSTIVCATEGSGNEPASNARESGEVQPINEEDSTNGGMPANGEQPTSEEQPINGDADSNNQGEVTPEDHDHEQDEIYEGDLYIFQNDYVMDKLVDGNVFILGQNVKITGKVNGSVFICASKVEIDTEAYIAYHLCVAAKEVYIKGLVFDVYSASDKLEIASEAVIYRQIKASAADVSFGGNVGRDASIFADNIKIDESSLIVYGDFVYEANNKIENLQDFVSGEVKFTQAKEHKDNGTVMDYVWSVISTVAFDILVYLLLIFFAPNFVKMSKNYVSTKGILAFVIGLAFIFIVPAITFLLCLTGILSGVGILAIVIYMAVLMINALVVATVANEFIADKIKIDNKFKKILMIIPVSIVLWGLREIPFVGTLISAIVCLYGIGIVILYQFDKRKEA